jgi:hypothetical protein
MGGESVVRAVGASDVFPRALQIEVTPTAANPAEIHTLFLWRKAFYIIDIHS